MTADHGAAPGGRPNRKKRGSGSPPSLVHFFVLAYLITWVFWVPSALMFGEDVAEDPFAAPGFVVLQTVGAAGPSIAAYVLLRRRDGGEALRRILDRYRVWRLPVRWYLAALLLVPLIQTAAILIGAAWEGTPVLEAGSALEEMVTDMGWIGFLVVFPLTVLGQLPTSPLLEEMGWRGFALPRLQDRYPALLSSLILGILWGLWHLPLTLAYGDPLVPYLVRIVSITVLITWVFNHTRGSMLLAMLFHASLNASLVPLSTDAGSWPSLILTVAAAAVVVGVYGHRHLSARERVRWSPLEGVPVERPRDR